MKGAIFTAVVAELTGEPSVSVGQRGKKGFGSSALQVNGKIFATVSSEGAFVVKLPKQRVEALEAQGRGQRFDPGHGRLMKEWLVLNQASTGEFISLAREALQFVGGGTRDPSN
ncbi:hypothetical protein J2W49_001737 [Hydrogenophaga palleronii]|uniref:TfoX N-terminal domain-containing protein n=1 Tax=Hydrogenophaga palleronii TaxID=65655 RepID=A0ABU1WL71_9BURK|nr:hypothetical protein [Hydrogenophaga palleronii]MDR7149782.1 hypothetical protein [Hydrogenophaga palleronii]